MHWKDDLLIEGKCRESVLPSMDNFFFSKKFNFGILHVVVFTLETSRVAFGIIHKLIINVIYDGTLACADYKLSI